MRRSPLGGSFVVGFVHLDRASTNMAPPISSGVATCDCMSPTRDLASSSVARVEGRQRHFDRRRLQRFDRQVGDVAPRGEHRRPADQPDAAADGHVQLAGRRPMQAPVARRTGSRRRARRRRRRDRRW